MQKPFVLVRAAALTSVIAGAAFGQSPTTAADVAPTLQQRVTALGQQIHWRYASDIVQRSEQRGRVERVLRQWNALAAPTAVDRELLVRWLDVATRSTMPGASGRLPAPPRFSIASGLVDPRRHGVSKPASAAGADAPRSEWSRHPAAAPLEWVDPFTDDPVQPDEDANRGADARPTPSEEAAPAIGSSSSRRLPGLKLPG